MNTEKNSIKKLFLQYAAHLTLSLEMATLDDSHHINKSLQKNGFKNSIISQRKCSYARRGQMRVYETITIAKQFAVLVTLVRQLVKNNANLLIIDGGDLSHQNVYLGYGEAQQSSGPTTACGYTSSMSSGWINGACSNWSSLSAVAWNSFQLKNLSLLIAQGQLGDYTKLDSWALHAAGIFSGLHTKTSQGITGEAKGVNIAPHTFNKSKISTKSVPKGVDYMSEGRMYRAHGPLVSETMANLHTLGKHTAPTAGESNRCQLGKKQRRSFKLSYKSKPDCIFLLNPSPSALKECSALNVPVWSLGINNYSHSTYFELKSNHESLFLNYLILCVICFCRSHTM